jgi:hypothetical protein
MSVTSSIARSVHQPDGSTIVYEEHSQAGITVCRAYIAAFGVDIDAELAAYALVVAKQLADDEAQQVIQ